VLDKDGVRTLSDDELRSASADRLQDIQRRLSQISKKLTWIVVLLAIIALPWVLHWAIIAILGVLQGALYNSN
jgi:hypothetical protein